MHQRVAGAKALDMSREAVPNLNQRVRVETDRDGGFECAVADGRSAQKPAIR
jgi:hypothetical protein